MGVEDGQKVNVIGLSSPGLCGFMLWLLGNYDKIYEVIQWCNSSKIQGLSSSGAIMGHEIC